MCDGGYKLGKLVHKFKEEMEFGPGCPDEEVAGTTSLRSGATTKHKGILPSLREEGSPPTGTDSGTSLDSTSGATSSGDPCGSREGRAAPELPDIEEADETRVNMRSTVLTTGHSGAGVLTV